MSIEISWVTQKMENWAPVEAAEKWDNVGLLIGDAEASVSKILVALDASEAVVREAAEGRYDLLITHHPLIFNPINRVTRQDSVGKRVITLIENNIHLYAAHTNLDMAEGGTSDLLFEKLGLLEKNFLLEPIDTPPFALGRVGTLPIEMTLLEFCDYVKKRLSLKTLRFAGNPGAKIKKAALCAGDASSLRYCREAVNKQCDVYITGDLRYHDAQDALAMGLNLIDATHYASEEPITSAIVTYLKKQAAGLSLIIEASKTDGQVFIDK